MKAMVLNKICNLKEDKNPLDLVELPVPVCGENEILVKVSACGVCHTELDEIEGRPPPSFLPIILGHQIVGNIVEVGKNVKKYVPEDRVGIAWIHFSCGQCRFCKEGNENLCESFRATGRDAYGAYAEYTTVPGEFVFPIPVSFSDVEAAPLLCAGAIGYRSLRLTAMKDGDNLGLIGFGASAHLVLKMVRFQFPHSKIFVFARKEAERIFAKELGAFWAGDIIDKPPEKIHRAIDTTPVWEPIVMGLKHLEKGGRLVINAIRKEETDKDSLLNLDYPGNLWLEKEIKSVANVTRRDVYEFLELAEKIPLKPEVQEHLLEEANTALMELKAGKIRGAKVLKIR